MPSTPLSEALEQLRELSRLYGPERIIWRYDPLVYWIENGRVNTNHDTEKFERLCRDISRTGVNQCYISFVHPYKKFTDRMRKKFPRQQIVNLPIEEKTNILQTMAAIAGSYNIRLYACSSDELLALPQIAKGRCINGALLNRLSGAKRVSEAKYPSRPDCGCTKSVDIGIYAQHPCRFGCIYCYANPLWE